MEKIRKDLADFFDDMLTHVKGFRRKTYNDVFEQGFRKYRPLISELSRIYGESPEEEKAAVKEELAAMVPDHAQERMQAQPKRLKERLSVDYNLTMAVYITPILTYTQDEFCIELCQRMVELWNEKKVTTLQLSFATYDDISSGFKRKWCYITTAVCESQGKPDDCYELTALRGYRDGYLMQSESGKALVEEYYDIAPVIVRAIDMYPDRERIYNEIYTSSLIPCIHCIEDGENETCRELYTGMVAELKEKYLCS